ncbi:methionine synthase [Micromonospora sp. CPCC 205371]|nr:methionine synthase [Micromonospora sp. CPCC 205371]
MTDFPWPPGSATGIGSLPGTDIAEAQRIVLGELPNLPHLPELPARGPGAEIIGRGGAFLVDLPVEVYAGRWRVAARPGHDLRRALDLLERDLDQMTEQASDYTGTFKIQAAGPYTLATGIDLAIGGRIMRDHGAVRDLTESLAEGLRAHVADVRRRLPRATVLLQIDEPSLPAALAGHIPTESGLHTYRRVESSTASTALRTVIEAVEAPVVIHCCAPDVPLDVVRSSGAAAVALDLDLLEKLDPLGEALDAGLGLFAGVSQHAASAGASPSAAVADRVRGLWQRLGFPVAALPAQVVVTPACGLADASPATVRKTLKALHEATLRLTESASS